MLNRATNKNFQEQNPTYLNCEISEYFKYFQNFAGWITKQVGYDKDFELDKDLLFKGNKIYSEDTCVLLPRELNNAVEKSESSRGKYPIGVSSNKNREGFQARFRKYGNMIHLGTFKCPKTAFQAYKIAKEAHLKELAEKWKTEIDPRAYNALFNYQVEIDD